MHSIIVFLILSSILINVQGSFDITDLDWSTRPSDNFFMFVNGRWINRTTIPSSESSWGGMYTLKYEMTYKLKRIFDDLIRSEKRGSSFAKSSIQCQLIDFYLSGLNEQAIERAGIQPLKETLIKLQNVNTYQELFVFILNWYKKMNQGLIFEFDVFVDERNTSVYMVNWKQTGISLPERDYYFRNDAISKNIRSNYVYYIDRLLNLTNKIVSQTTNLIDAEDILSLETQLAVSHRTPAQLRDSELNYNKYNIDQLDRMMPNLKWHQILSILTIENKTVLMAQPDYYQLLDKLIVSQPLDVWKNKIRFTLLHEMASYLNKDFVQARFYMFNHIIYGQREDQARWMKLIDVIEKYIGELLGQLYISRYFSPQSKQRTLDLVKNLIDVYQDRINRMDWISDATKIKALKKLQTMSIKIGYPSKWKSFDDIHMNRSSYFDTISSIFQYSYRKKMKDLRKPVDRDEWFMSPQTVNAYYNPQFNEIVFPAAILQEPFFAFDADDALNYGGIGYVIGHELTHSLDDEGRKYDEYGNLRPWWTQNDINAFNSRTEYLVKQYENYIVLNTKVNGQLTLGENIADLGGVEIAYEAFLRTKQAKLGRLIDGLTAQQRFFLAFARSWRNKCTNEKTLSGLKEDPHAPAITRINGPLSNMMGFYQIYNVKQGDVMYREPENRIIIW